MAYSCYMHFDIDYKKMVFLAFYGFENINLILGRPKIEGRSSL